MMKNEKEWQNFIAQVQLSLEKRGFTVQKSQQKSEYKEKDISGKLIGQIEEFISVQLSCFRMDVDDGFLVPIHIHYQHHWIVCLKTWIGNDGVPWQIFREYRWWPKGGSANMIISGLLMEMEKKFKCRTGFCDYNVQDLKKEADLKSDSDFNNFIQEQESFAECELTLTGGDGPKSIDLEDFVGVHADAYDFLMKAISKCNQKGMVLKLITAYDKIFDQVIGYV